MASKPRKRVAARVADKIADVLSPKAPEPEPAPPVRISAKHAHDWKPSVPFGDQFKHECRNCGVTEIRKTA